MTRASFFAYGAILGILGFMLTWGSPARRFDAVLLFILLHAAIAVFAMWKRAGGAGKCPDLDRRIEHARRVRNIQRMVDAGKATVIIESADE